jgi:hypothetical protein
MKAYKSEGKQDEFIKIAIKLEIIVHSIGNALKNNTFFDEQVQ